jgi:hypothetical protein
MQDSNDNPTGINFCSHVKEDLGPGRLTYTPSSILYGDIVFELPSLSHADTYIDMQAEATKAAARTNPARPHVRLPVAAAELRDLPRIIQVRGRSLLQKGAEHNLRYNFGIKPLVNDLLSLIGFADAYQQRSAEVEKLISKGGLKRRFTGATDENTISGRWSALVSSYSGYFTTTTTDKCWFVINWEPSTYVQTLDRFERASFIKRRLLGLGLEQQLANAWESLPWSWLIDWFSTIGSWMQANNNSIAHIASISGQRLIESKHTLESIVDDKGHTIDIPERTYRHFLRSAYHPTITATKPLLSGSQVGILASLAVLRK